jgi:sugar phosphate isomerase/epimerase
MKFLLVAAFTSAFMVAAAQAQFRASSSEEGELFKVAIAGYTFVHFNLDETLEMMRTVDVHYLCIKDFHLPLNSTDEQIAEFHAKLARYDVKGYAVGPIYMKTKEEVDRAFDYARRVGVDLIVGVPNHELLPCIDQKVKEYDMKYAIHLHGPDIELYPNAKDIYERVKNLDKRIGMCLDIGHNARDGQDPVSDLKKYKNRVFDIHMKNTTAAAKEGKTGEIGRGVINIPDFVRMLRKVKYAGACSLEYERNMKAPLTGIAESTGYFRGVIDGTKKQ